MLTPVVCPKSLSEGYRNSRNPWQSTTWGGFPLNPRDLVLKLSNGLTRASHPGSDIKDVVSGLNTITPSLQRPAPRSYEPPHTFNSIYFTRHSLSDMVLRLRVVLTVALSLVTVAFAGPTKYGNRTCGNHLTRGEINARESRFTDALSRIETPTRISDHFSNRTVPVYFNVISSGTGISQGCILYVFPRPYWLSP